MIKRLGLPVLLSVVTFLLLWRMAAAWLIETQQSVTCTIPPAPFQLPLRYYELVLEDQHPTYPEYGAKIFINYGKPSELEKSLTELIIRRSAVGTYASSIVKAGTSYDPKYDALTTKGFNDLGLIPKKGLHRYFPFDSAEFKFEIETTPWLEPNTLRVTNRVPGFYLPCSLVRMALGEKHLEVAFKLYRSPLIVLVTVTLCFMAIVFALIIIFKLNRIEDIASSTASFFLSLWSIRGILSAQLHVFPTLLDFILLTICSLLLVGLLWKIALPQIETKKRDDSLECKRDGITNS